MHGTVAGVGFGQEDIIYIYTEACMFSLCHVQHPHAFAPGLSTLNRVLELDFLITHLDNIKT